MTKLLLTAAIAATLGMPTFAMAQTAPSGVSFACRPIGGGETATTTIDNMAVVCHALDMDKIRQAMTAAMVDLTPEQKAKVEFAMQVLRDELELQPHYPGFNGDPND